MDSFWVSIACICTTVTNLVSIINHGIVMEMLIPCKPGHFNKYRSIYLFVAARPSTVLKSDLSLTLQTVAPPVYKTEPPVYTPSNTPIYPTPNVPSDPYPTDIYPYDPYEPYDPYDPYPFYYCELNEDEYGRPYYGPYDEYRSPYRPPPTSYPPTQPPTKYPPSYTVPPTTYPPPVYVRPLTTTALPPTETYQLDFEKLARRKRRQVLTLPSCITSNECRQTQGMITCIILLLADYRYH